jgi:hypothetical protein
LDRDGLQLVSDLLTGPNTSIEDVIYDAAAWADSVADVRKYADSRHFHFVNIPYRVCDGFKLDRDCDTPLGQRTCSVVAIRDYIHTIKAEHLRLEERADGIKFLMHFIADLHQPLHIAFQNDKGGAKIEVYPPWDHPITRTGRRIYTPGLKSLHMLWDTHIIQYVMSNQSLTWTELADSIVKSFNYQGTAPMRTYSVGHFASIANETAILGCEKAYKNETGDWLTSGTHLSKKYYDESANVILEQLGKAGREIASFLNEIGNDLYYDMMSSASSVPPDDEGYATDVSDFMDDESFDSDDRFSEYVLP